MSNLEVLTIAEYLIYSDKETSYELLVKSVQHAFDKNFDLYMTYDKSCEPTFSSISWNMLTNAIIDLTHKQPVPEHSSYKAKSSDFYRNYYGKGDNGGWKSHLLHIKDNLSTLIDNVGKYNVAKDTAFPNNANFIGAIDKAAWIALNYK